MKIHEFLKLMETIRADMGGEYAPQQLAILLLSAVRPGITHNEIADVLKLSQGAISRNVTKLSSKDTDHSGIGKGLVEKRSDEVYDSRRSAIWLTDEGKALINKIKKAIV
jgi:DNA-binding MarR family transcriptional regulator